MTEPLRICEVDPPRAYGFDRKHNHIHVLVAGFPIARDTGIVFVLDIDQSPRANDLPDYEGWRRILDALEQAKRTLPEALRRVAPRRRLTSKPVANRQLIEWLATGSRHAYRAAAVGGYEEVHVDARLSLNDASAPWSEFGAPVGFDPVELLTLGWGKDGTPAQWKHRFEESGHVWPDLITSKVFPGLPLFLTNTLDELLERDLHAPTKTPRSSSGTAAQRRARWCGNILYMVHSAQQSAQQLAGAHKDYDYRPLTQAEIASELWNVWKHEFVASGLTYPPLQPKNPSNSIHCAMEQLLLLVDDRYDKDRQNPMERYHELLKNGRLLEFLKPIAVFEEFRAPGCQRSIERFKAVLSRNLRRRDVATDPAILAAEAEIREQDVLA